MGNDFTTYAPRKLGCGDVTGDVDVRPVIVSYSAPWSDPITERAHRIWSAGDYDRISSGFRHEAESFVERQSLTAGEEVLDSACGSGNLTIPAARTGAKVTGFDIVPSLLEATANWATRERLPIRVDLGTVEDLPYPDASFDVVLSMFGVLRTHRAHARGARQAAQSPADVGSAVPLGAQ